MSGLPIQVEVINSLLGSHEGMNPVLLPEMFSSSGSQNMMIDELGRALSVPGYSKQNTGALYTADTSGDAVSITGMYHVKTFGAAGAITRQLIYILDDANNEWEIGVSSNNGVTGTFKEDLGAGSAGALPDFAQYKADTFIVNGVIAPRKWNGSNLSTVGLTRSPTPTAVNTSASNGLLAGNYRWKLVSVDNAGLKAAGSVASTVESVPLGNTGVLSWTADANTNVVGYEVYRTTGTGTLFYYEGWVEGRTTVAWTSTASDETILEKRSLTEHGEPPATGTYFCETHGDRVWWLRTDTNPGRAFWSDLGLPESVGTFSYLDFSDPSGFAEVITGAWGNFDKKLVVFTDSGIWTVSGTGAVIGNVVDWTKKRSNANAGAVSHRCLAKVPAGAKWRDEAGDVHTTDQNMLVYPTRNRDIRLFNGIEDIVISAAMKTTLASVATQNLAAHTLHLPTQQTVVFFQFDASGTSIVTAWNYRFGVWYSWVGMAPTFAIVSSVDTDTSTSPSVPLIGRSGAGQIFKFLDSAATSFDGTAIDSRWMSNTFYGRLGEDTVGKEQSLPALPFTKRWRWVDLNLKSFSAASLTFSWFPGSTAAGGTATGTATVTPTTTAQTTNQKRIQMKTSNGRFLHDQGIRLMVSRSSTTQTQWAIEALAIGFQILPGLKRRSQ